MIRLALEALGHAVHQVVDHGAGHTPHGARALGSRARRDADGRTVRCDLDIVGDDEAEFALAALNGDLLTVDLRRDPAGMTALPTRHLRFAFRSEHPAEHFAAHVLLTCRMVGHNALRESR